VAPGAFERLRAAAPALSVGMATADLGRLGEEMRRLEGTGVPCVHFDVMDGHFAPALTFGPPLVAAVHTSLLKDVHLMIEDPLASVAEYVAAGADVVTVHVESTRHPHRVLQALGAMKNANDPARGLVRGVALNPGTPLEALDPLLGDCELVLLLAVNPGWSGQRFLPGTADRARRAREHIRAAGRDVLLGIDGGVRRDNIEEIAALGADLVVTGSAVFDGRDPDGNARFLADAVRRAAAA
jgi:ribulose-phosphate 3-epimerase